MKRSAILALATLLFGSTAWAQSCNTADRSVLLILDASGSMNARLPNGETRMAVAQRAIKGVARFVPAQAQLSLRMYGAQSAASRKNCQDTHLAVPFGAASAAGGPDHGGGRRRQGARLHADRLFARTSSERFPGRRQGARHRPRERRQGDLPGRSGGRREGARGQGHHRSHRRLHRRHRGARAAPGHRARDRRHLFRRAGRSGTAGHAQAGAQCVRAARRHAAGEAEAREAADDVGDLVYVSRRAQRGDRREGQVRSTARYQGVDLPAGIYEVKFGPAKLEGDRGAPRRDHHDRRPAC